MKIIIDYKFCGEKTKTYEISSHRSNVYKAQKLRELLKNFIFDKQTDEINILKIKTWE